MITRVVLAAGAGRRMGRTKALLDFGGRSALEIIGRLEVAEPSETIVVTGHDRENVTTEAERLGLRVVHNPDWDHGRSTSVRVGLEARDGDSRCLMIHPVDMPLIGQRDYDACLEAWEQESRADAIVVTSHDMRRGHPVLFGSEHFDAIAALEDDEPLRKVMHARVDDVRHVVVEHDGVLIDLDTPDDYERAKKFLG